MDKLGHWGLFSQKKQRSRILISALCGIWLGLPAKAAWSEERRQLAVAAAADLQYAMDALIKQFGEANPEVSVKVTFGSSGTLYSQLVKKAPQDLFFSADTEYPEKLQRAGLAKGLFRYGRGKLVLWVPKASLLPIEKIGVQVLRDHTVKKVAIANPRFAPFGRAAEKALKHLGLYADIKSKLVLGENIAQAAQFVQSGAADAALLAHSLASSPAMRELGRFIEVPKESYPALIQAAVIMNSSQERGSGERFRSFVLSAKGRSILETFGIESPSP